MDSLTKKELDVTRGFHYRYYTHINNSAKYTLLLLHGFPDDAGLWQYMIPDLLTSGLNLIAPDLLGYGGTSKPTDPEEFNWELMSNDMLDILQAEGIKGNVIPMGHDWGSTFSQRLYMLHKPLFAALINLSVALMPPIPDPFSLETINNTTEQTLGYPLYAYWTLFLPPAGAQLLEAHLESTWYALHGDAEDWMRRIFCTHGAFDSFIRADRTDIPLKPYAQNEKLRQTWLEGKRAGGMLSPTCWYRALAFNHQQATEAKLEPRVEVPYLFISGEGDAVCRGDAIERPKKEGLVPDCTARELQSGHWGPYERPGEIAEVVLGWLRGKGFLGE